MTTDTVNLHKIWRETMNRLKLLSERVSEGRDVVAASEFARWLSWSGIITLCKANPQDAPLTVDGSLMEFKTNELLTECNERFRTSNSDPNFKAAEFQSLHEKLDKMAGYLSKLSVAPAVAVRPPESENVDENVDENVGSPDGDVVKLVVMPGGLDVGGHRERNGKCHDDAEVHRKETEAVS